MSTPEAGTDRQDAESRRTFVIWITRDGARGEDGRAIAGRLEDVDTGRELKFQSAGQLIEVLERCLDPDGRR
jgi:hypothetical protein